MAQFGVHANPGRRRSAIPFVVSLQNARHDRARTRLVAALVVAASIKVDDPTIAPTLSIDGQLYVLDVYNLAVVPTERLGPAVASLADEDSRAKLVRAMDELLSQA